MKRVLVTGMSGTGKSSILEELQRRGYTVVDADSEAWCELKSVIVTVLNETEPHEGWVWREDLMTDLLQQKPDTPLFVSGCVSNQGKFYPLFDHVVLLSAPAEVILERIATRTNNPYGKTAVERAEILENLEFVEPLLRAGCDVEFDTFKLGVQRLADELVGLVNQ